MEIIAKLQRQFLFYFRTSLVTTSVATVDFDFLRMEAITETSDSVAVKSCKIW
jgi:hypothetical protein